MALLRTLVRLKLLPLILFVVGFMVPIILAMPKVVPFTYMAAFFAGTFGATIGLILHMSLAQNQNVQGDPAKADSLDRLKTTLTSTKQWLDKQPESTQRAFAFELASNLTVTIRTSVGHSPETGTIQMANEFLHWVVQWLRTPNTFKQTAAEMLEGAHLAFRRAEEFRPAPDVEQIIFAIDQAMKSAQL
jgi:hypothetical protein